MMPEFLAKHPAHGTELLKIVPEWEAVPAHLFAVTPATVLPNRIKRLIGLMKEQFGEKIAEMTDNSAA